MRTDDVLQCVVKGDPEGPDAMRKWDAVFCKTQLMLMGIKAREDSRSILIKHFFLEPKFYIQDDGDMLASDGQNNAFPPFFMVPKYETLRERVKKFSQRLDSAEVCTAHT